MVEKEAIELVVARLRSMPDNALIAAGMGFSPMGREEIIIDLLHNKAFFVT